MKELSITYNKTVLKVINFHNVAEENIIEQNPYWPHIHYHSYIILIIGCFRSREKTVLLTLINYQTDLDKINSYTKDQYEAKFQLSINKRESLGLKYFNDSKAFIEYLSNMEYTHKKIDECNQNKELKILVKLVIRLLICVERRKNSTNGKKITYCR